MLAYQSDAEKRGAAVALNSRLLSGTVSGMYASRATSITDTDFVLLYHAL